jgi:hypothetical protein
LKSFTSPATEKGILQVTVISAILAKKLNDVKCVLNLPGGNTETDVANYDAKQNPIFGLKSNREISLKSNV